MKFPNAPWKKLEAIGGTERINTVRKTPSPPCCSAIVFTPGESPASSAIIVRYWVAKLAATAATIFIATVTMKLNTTSESVVPRSCCSRQVNTGFVLSNSWKSQDALFYWIRSGALQPE